MYKSYKLTEINNREIVIAAVKALDLHEASDKFTKAGYSVFKVSRQVKLANPIKVKKKEITHETIKKRNIFYITNGEFRKLKDISIRFEKGVYHLV